MVCGSLLLLQVDWIDQDLWVVHTAPTDQTTVIGERRELVLLNVLVNCLLDTEVLAGHCDDNET